MSSKVVSRVKSAFISSRPLAGLDRGIRAAVQGTGFSSVPDVLGYFGYARFLGQLFQPQRGPLLVIMFVTERCNCHCRHCFLETAESDRGELSLTELESVAASMSPVMVMFLTGGEPFLRTDLPEIARIFARACHVRRFQIPTNGAEPERIAELAPRLARACPETHVGFMLSLDAIDERHDELRGRAGLSEAVRESARILRSVQSSEANVSFNVNITVTPQNQQSVEETYRYARDTLGSRNVLYTIVRGRPLDSYSRSLDPEILSRLHETILEDSRHLFMGHRGFAFSDVTNRLNEATHELQLRRLRGEGLDLLCQAGERTAVIRCDGEVYPCELRSESLGNLRDTGFDFSEIWRSSRRAELVTQFRQEKCFCTHECFLGTNLLFTGRFLKGRKL